MITVEQGACHECGGLGLHEEDYGSYVDGKHERNVTCDGCADDIIAPLNLAILEGVQRWTRRIGKSYIKPNRSIR